MYQRSGLTRRQLLQTGSTGLFIGIAGCNSASPQPTDEPNTTTPPLSGQTQTQIPSDEASQSSVSAPSVPAGMWPMYGYDSVGSSYNPHVTGFSTKPAIEWSLSLKQSRPHLLYSDSTLTSQGDTIAVVDPKTQNVTRAPRQVPLTVHTVWRGTAYYTDTSAGKTAASEVGFHDSQQDGDAKWTVDFNAVAGKLVESTFYAITGDQRLIALDKETGDQQWSKSVPGLTFIVTNQNIIIQTDQKVLALDRHRGTKQWERKPHPDQLRKQVDWADWQQDLINSGGMPTVSFAGLTFANGTLLLTYKLAEMGSHVVSGYDPRAGEPKWFNRGGTPYCTTNSLFFDTVSARSVSNGTQQWQIGINEYEYPPWSAIATKNHFLVVTRSQEQPLGALYAFNNSDGSLAWKLNIDKPLSQCIAVKDTIYATTATSNEATLLAIK